jgi:tRNA 2-selenouridine synthase
MRRRSRRGGLRSRLVVEMIARDDVHAVAGGYKALRAHLLAGLEEALERKRLVVLTGLTGTGKTALLQSLAAAGGGAGALHALDLEGAAHHRGSAFGALDEPQPSQATFENAVAAELVLGAAPTVVVEDESRHVGRLVVPAPLLEAMRHAPVAVLEIPLEARVARVFDEYVRAPTARHGGAVVRSRLDESLVRLRPRLGGVRTAALRAGVAAAEAAWGDVDAHRAWIAELLQGYYDRRYAKALAGHGRPLLARGDAATVRDALLTAAA